MIDKGIAVFDMDGTLLDGRTVFAIAEEFNFREKVEEIMNGEGDGHVKSERIAGLLRGLRRDDCLNIVKKIPLMEGAEETVCALKKKRYITGIISDSYTFATEYLEEKLKLDFAIANELEEENGVFTGRMSMPIGRDIKENCLRHSVCKRFILKRIAGEKGVPLTNCVAVGDNLVDLCMIQEAGAGIAFDPKHPALRNNAKIVIINKDLREILRFLP